MLHEHFMDRDVRKVDGVRPDRGFAGGERRERSLGRSVGREDFHTPRRFFRERLAKFVNGHLDWLPCAKEQYNQPPEKEGLTLAKPRVYVTRIGPPPGPDLVRQSCDAEFNEAEGPPSRQDLLAKVKGLDGLLCLLTEKIDAELLNAAGPQLRVVSSFSVGFDHIDVPECTKRGVYVGYTPGVLTDATADLAMALLFATARRISESERWARAGKWKIAWNPNYFLGQDVWGATVGILGLGRIGHAFAKRCRGMNMRILYYDLVRAKPELEQEVGAEFVPLDRLLAESDFVSVHVNLSEQTKGLINETSLRKMKKTAHLINTSRGPVVDEPSLAKALKEGWIAGAGLDVYEKEPLAPGHPFYLLENVVIAPHIASATHTSRGKMSEISARNLINVLRGEEPLHLVNPEVKQVRPLAAAKVS